MISYENLPTSSFHKNKLIPISIFFSFLLFASTSLIPCRHARHSISLRAIELMSPLRKRPRPRSLYSGAKAGKRDPDI